MKQNGNILILAVIVSLIFVLVVWHSRNLFSVPDKPTTLITYKSSGRPSKIEERSSVVNSNLRSLKTTTVGSITGKSRLTHARHSYGSGYYPSASRSLAVSNVYTPQSSNGIISLSSEKVVHSYGVGSSSAVNNSSKISSATSKSSTSNVSSVASTLLSTPGSSISFPLYASNATQIQEEKYGVMSSPVYNDYRFINKTGSLSGLANADLRKLYNQDGLVSYSHIQLPSIKRRIGGGISTTELEWFIDYLASIGITWTGNYSDLEQFLYDDDDGNQYFTPEFVQAYYDWLAQTTGSGIFPDWMKDSIIRAPIGEGQVLLFFLLFYSFILFIRNKHKNTILS